MVEEVIMEVLAHGPITVRQDRLKVATVAITIINDTLTIFRHIFVKPINMTHFSFVTHRKLLDLLSGCKINNIQNVQNDVT